MPLVLHKDVWGDKVTQYYAAGDPDNELLVRYDHDDGSWRSLRKSRTPGSKWEDLPGKYASPEKAKAALEVRLE